jgi:hypothetical protein
LQAGLTGGDWNPLNWHWREMLAVAQIAGQRPTHPASITYFSMAPIRFGNFVAKYRAKPAGDRHESYLALVQRLASQADAMRLALEDTLDTQEVLFEFQVQLRTSSADDAHRRRHGRVAGNANPRIERSPTSYCRAKKIALLRQQDAYQNLAFNVWHALAVHRPLGGINRVRRRAYAVSCAWRRQQPSPKLAEPPNTGEVC